MGRLLKEGVKRERSEVKIWLGKWFKFVLGRNCKFEVEYYIDFKYEFYWFMDVF